jgi:hypothetical protein
MDERVLVITPSRGRPARLAHMLEETLRLSGPGTHVAVCYDEDDPESGGYAALAARTPGSGRVLWFRGPRRSLAGWTNWVAGHPRACRYRYLASFGDDHVPQTPGWDERLTAAIEAIGGTGIAYGDDRHQHENLPTAPVISADIVRVLGWLILPGVRSKFCDNAWRDLADLAGCRAYCGDVIIEHVHPDAGKAGWDATYGDGHASWAADEAVYLNWVADPGDGDPSPRDADVNAVRNAMRLRARTCPREPA